MKNLLRIEEAFMFGLSIFLFSKLDYAWWWYALLILAPDLSMVGYLVSTQVGAMTYNFIHHKALGIGIFVLGSKNFAFHFKESRFARQTKASRPQFVF